jgi:hypothetical protein
MRKCVLSLDFHATVWDFRSSWQQVWRRQVFWDRVPCSLTKVTRSFKFPSTSWWLKQYATLKRQSTSTRLHGALSQKPAFSMLLDDYWRLSGFSGSISIHISEFSRQFLPVSSSMSDSESVLAPYVLGVQISVTSLPIVALTFYWFWMMNDMYQKHTNSTRNIQVNLSANQHTQIIPLCHIIESDKTRACMQTVLFCVMMPCSLTWG